MPPPPEKPSLPKEKQPIVISGPSGSGKSTVITRLLKENPGKFELSISHTTRKPRGAEKNGVEYHFVPVSEFESMISAGKFIEHAQFGSNYYGTSYAAVEDIESRGATCIFDIEMEGVKQIHTSHLQARYLFIQPPSEEVLERRLRGRGTDSEDAVLKRLAQAKKELAYAKEEGVHDRLVINDDLEEAYAEVRAFCLGED